MQTITEFAASAVPPDRLRDILADYIALDRARSFRRLLVLRCGLLALLASVIGGTLGGFSPFERWFAIAVFLVPPAWAWIAERRLAGRLARDLDGIESTVKS
jgi:hypothetical protein